MCLRGSPNFQLMTHACFVCVIAASFRLPIYCWYYRLDCNVFCLWARVITTGLHSDYDTSPELPALLGSTAKCARRESLSDAMSGAAVAFADDFKRMINAKE